ncbi:MAG: GGDEF domain-containing protein [bacterium]|nr:GGDEF domain-containing protein [bacterium]
MGESPKFERPTTLEEEHELTLERSKYLLEHIANQEEQHSIEHLTRLKTRKVFDTELKLIFGEVEEKRHGVEPVKKIALILIDLDYFKQVNDTKGHAAGDEVLREVSALLIESVRPTDTVARFGGEELVVLMRGADMQAAKHHAEELRAKIQELRFAAYPGLEITASFGVCSTDVSDKTNSSTLLEQVDVALYKAKNGGRNRVEIYK